MQIMFAFITYSSSRLYTVFTYTNPASFFRVSHSKIIYIIKAGVCQHSNVPTLTSPPVLKLWDIQGYLWLPYDLTEVINLIGERFKPKQYFFSKKYPMSFLPHYCHSFPITVILSGFLSFLPD